MSVQVEKPRVVAFEVTRRCKYNCVHCRADASDGAKADELTGDQCKRIIRSLADYNKCMLILTGGEPMERGDIYELAETGTGLGLRISLATCGYTLDSKALGRLKDSGVMALSFSIDGASAETHDSFRQTPGAYDAVINAAKLANKAGIKFQINTTVTNANIEEFAAIAELAKRLGAGCFNPFILVPTGRGRDISDQLLDSLRYESLLNELIEMHEHEGIEIRLTCGPQFARVVNSKKIERLKSSAKGCLGGRTFGFISCRGDVQTCGFLDVSAGNLVENGFDFGKIWDESVYLKKIRDVEGFNGPCAVCEYVSECRGCRARAYSESGDVTGSDPICCYKTKS